METLSTPELGLPPDIWRSLITGHPAIHCPVGYMIYLQQTEATCFYYLKSGTVKSYIQSEAGDERVLNIYHSGCLFGEASFFDELPRVSSAVAMTPCEVISITRDMVYSEIARHPEIAMAMMKYLSRTVRIISTHVDDMAFHSADCRIARYLLALPGESDMVLSCTQDEIASSIAISRVTVSRILKEFSRKGWVKTGYRKVTLLNREALEDLIEG